MVLVRKHANYYKANDQHLMALILFCTSFFVSKMYNCANLGSFPGMGNKLPILWRGCPWILIVGGPFLSLIYLSSLIPMEVNANIMLYVHICC